jgi:predicted Zn-dependent protease with MMP-like domain
MRLSPEEFARLVADALAELPEFAREYLENVVVDVEPMPAPQDYRELGIDDPRELLGMYHGIPLPDRGLEDVPIGPDRITIYQRNVERICETREEVIEQVRTTVLHEIGHHFGLDEEDLEDVGYD